MDLKYPNYYPSVHCPQPYYPDVGGKMLSELTLV